MKIHSGSLLGHCLYTLHHWERLLVFLEQENAFCKLRLAEIIEGIEGDRNLVKAEEFNEQFISQDGMIDFLDAELKKHSKLLQKDLYADGTLLKAIVKNQTILERNVQYAEDIFLRTRRRFSIFLLSLL